MENCIWPPKLQRQSILHVLTIDDHEPIRLFSAYPTALKRGHDVNLHYTQEILRQIGSQVFRRTGNMK